VDHSCPVGGTQIASERIGTTNCYAELVHFFTLPQAGG
jgi:hypothetical protein